MPYVEHTVVKASDVVDSIVGLVEPQLTIPKLVTQRNLMDFAGRENDTLTQRVPGRLPSRTYAFRNDRTNPLIYDVYKEAKVDITLGDRLYSGVELTDEQYDFDFGSDWMKLANAQAMAVGEGLNSSAAKAITDAPYEVTIGGVAPAIKSALVEARKVLNKMRVPNESRILLVGAEFEAAMLNDDNFTAAVKAGETRAENALGDATIGRAYGFNIVSSIDIDGDVAYAFIPSAYVQLTAAPSIPASAPFGAAVSYGGFSLRWIRSYDINYLTDRSVIDSYLGTEAVKDIIIPREIEASQAPFDPSTLGQHFIRGIKLTLGGTSVYPAKTSDLAKSTGVSADNAWVAPTTETPVTP